MKHFIYLLLLVVVPGMQTVAKDITVGESGRDYTVIQAAIDFAEAGDVILVDPGTYYENITTNNKAITIRSTDGAEDTIIDGSGYDRCATLGATRDETATILEGFTLQKGKLSGDRGGGVRSGTLYNCIITNNTTEYGGGGAYYSTLINCVIKNNISTGYGGGSNDGTLVNCLIYDNKGKDGGGSCGDNLYNCTLYGNNATTSGGGAYNSNHYNCISWGNKKNGTDNNIQGGTIEYTYYYPNSVLDPLFVDAAAGNFRLQLNSPCIDAGSNDWYDNIYSETDLDGNLRIVNIIDMGAYEALPPTCPRPTALTVNDITPSGAQISWIAGGSESAWNLIISPTAITDFSNVSAETINTTTHTASSLEYATFYYVYVQANCGDVDQSGWASTTFTTVPPTILPDTNKRIYVNKTRNGTGDSWSNAAKELAHALKAAETLNAANAGTVTEIWVAKGTYTPLYKIAETDNTGALTTSRDQSFVLVKDVKIYGGFAGGETSTQARDWETNPTILSGDIGIIDYNADNCYHVVIGAGDVGTACLDGVTITGGNADGSSSIRVNGLDYYRNYGGGMYNFSSSPVLTNVTISGNTATSSGGGMYNWSSSPVLTNVTISGNTATSSGGGMYNYSSSSPVLTNVTINGNTAYSGGGMYNNYYSYPQIRNSIIRGSVYNNNTSTPTYTHSLVEGVTTAGDGDDNIDGSLEPQFVNADAGDFRLQPNSPCVDKGSNSYYQSDETPDLSAITTDIAGNPRLVGITDIGAYEFVTPVVSIDGGINYFDFTNATWSNYPEEIRTADSITVKGLWTNKQIGILQTAKTSNYNGSLQSADMSAMAFSEDITTGLKYFFQKDTVLTKVILPEVETRNQTDLFCLFDDCSKLKEVRNLDKFTQVTYMGLAFENCSQLSSITLPEGNGGMSISFDGAFNGCSSLEEIRNLEKFTNVKSFYYTFQNCTRLSSVTLPEGNGGGDVAFNSAFENCTSLEEVQNLDKFTGLTYFTAAFRNCSRLSSITLPEGNGGKSIQFNSSFSGCTALKTITNLEKFTNISDFRLAFENCYSLTSVSLGNIPAINSTSSAFAGTNPNCLIYLPAGTTEAQIPTTTSWPNRNYLARAATAGEPATALRNITLTDGKPFNCPVPFDVPSDLTISYTRDFTGNFATPANGWNTFSIPFNAEMRVKGEASTVAAKIPFAADNDNKGEFWLKTLSGGEDTKVSFDYTKEGIQIQPNIPYLIALPGEVFEEASMHESPVMQFTASDITVEETPDVSGLSYAPAGSEFEYVCSYDSLRSGDIYVLMRGGEGEGDVFACPPTGVEAGVLPFRAYIKAVGGVNRARVLRITNEGGTTGLSPALSEGEGAGREANKAYKIMTPDGIRIIVGDKMYTIEGVAIDNAQLIIDN